MSKQIQRSQMLTETEVEGMIIGNWEIDTEIRFGDDRILIHHAKGTWKITTTERDILGFIKPENCISSEELLEEINKF